MNGSSMDPVALAAVRLEAAVDRLAEVLSRPRPEPAPAESPPADPAAADPGIPREAVLALAGRLDETIARLRAALVAEGAAEGDAEGDEGEP